jgi:hypothetical protein
MGATGYTGYTGTTGYSYNGLASNNTWTGLNDFTNATTATTQTLGASNGLLATTLFVSSAFSNFLTLANTWTGVQSVATATAGSLTTAVANCLYVQTGITNAINGLLSANNSWTGTNSVPTPTIATNNTTIANTSFVYTAINSIPKPLTVQIYDNASAGATFNTVGAVPWSHSYTSAGGKLMIFASFSAYSTVVQACAFNLLIDGAITDTVYLSFNVVNVKCTLPTFLRVNSALSVGAHTIGIQIGTANTVINIDDHLNLSVIEFA